MAGDGHALRIINTGRQHDTLMKITTSIIILVCLSILTCCPVHAEDIDKAYGTIHFENVPVSDVLDVYKGLAKQAKQELIVSTDVRRAIHGITLPATKIISVEAARQLLEQALLKQAGVVITRLDKNRVSVTYNDKLELRP